MAFEISLGGKTCVIIGGARGIGAECVRKLAQAGADVAFGYTSAHDHAKKLEEEAGSYGVRIKGYSLDVSDEQQVKDLFCVIAKDFGHIDVLVYNAAVLIASPFAEMSSDIWHRTMAVNVDGAFYSAQAALPLMLKKGGGKMIFISSNATINAGGNSVAYPASKGALEGLAKQILKEYLSKGINVNIISPAVIDTDMFRERYPTDEVVADYGKSLPVGRVGTPEDIANAVVFFASDKASYICGHNLIVDGGRTYYIK
jgi:NAD(P)-dependent dehydrogenase (short-subunit alcohol dehydrogenase family)